MPLTARVASGAAEPAAPPRPAWRTDIEGLRGVAVLLVVLYHAAVPGFSGGYIGVDVFFALSGYLITGILVREAEETGAIDLPRFYARRARRLLPAIALLLVVVAALAFVFYAPLAQTELAKTALATAAYASNIFFGRRATDYLAAEAETNPLLHTWSLAVEEQFYIVWPAFVLLLLVGPRRLLQRHGRSTDVDANRRWLVAGTAAFALASFVLTLYLMSSGGAHWAFFSSPTRGWEFALGGLGVLVPRVRWGRAWTLAGLSFDRLPERVPPLAQWAGWVGLGAVVASSILFSAHTPFPGWAAALPVVGTVLVLRAGTAETDTALARALSWRPLREVGRLSYSWYLWHWPVLVFAVGLYGEQPLVVRVLLAAASLGLAEASYRLVENPVRRSRRLGRRPAYGIALLVGLTVCSVGLAAAWWAASSAEQTAPGQARYAAARDDVADLYGRGCHDDYAARRPTACSEGAAGAPFTVALFGDSHAAQWAPALQQIAAERGWRLVYLTKSSCPALQATIYSSRLGRIYAECGTWREAVLDTLATIRPDAIVTSSESAYGLRPDVWRRGSERLFAELAAVADRVVVLRDVPRPRTDVPVCLAQRARQRRLGIPPVLQSPPCDFAPEDDIQLAVHRAQIEAARRFENVQVVDLTDRLCPDGVCDVETEAFVMYRDDHHLTARFAASAAVEVERAIVGTHSTASPVNERRGKR